MKTCPYLAVGFAILSFSAYAGTDMKDMKEMRVTPELRSDAGPYVAAYGGSEFDTGYGDKRETISTDTGSTFSDHDDIHSGYGGVGGIKGGYNFESFPICDTWNLRLQPAVEAEALYLGTDAYGGFNGPTVPFPGVFVAQAPPPIVTQGTTKQSFNSAAWFINGILRLKNNSIITPYIGAGVGGEYITIHGEAFSNIPGNTHITGLNGSDLDFAAQALAGFDIALFSHFSIFTEYKFIDALGTDAKTSNVGGTSYTYRFKPDQIQQHLIVAGLKYSF